MKTNSPAWTIPAGSYFPPGPVYPPVANPLGRDTFGRWSVLKKSAALLKFSMMPFWITVSTMNRMGAFTTSWTASHAFPIASFMVWNAAGRTTFATSMILSKTGFSQPSHTPRTIDPMPLNTGWMIDVHSQLNTGPRTFRSVPTTALKTGRTSPFHHKEIAVPMNPNTGWITADHSHENAAPSVFRSTSTTNPKIADTVVHQAPMYAPMKPNTGWMMSDQSHPTTAPIALNASSKAIWNGLIASSKSHFTIAPMSWNTGEIHAVHR